MSGAIKAVTIDELIEVIPTMIVVGIVAFLAYVLYSKFANSDTLFGDGWLYELTGGAMGYPANTPSADESGFTGSFLPGHGFAGGGGDGF